LGNVSSLGKTPTLKKYEKDFYIQCNVYRDANIDGYFEFYELNKRTMHPVLLAAEMHERLVTIHPFIDGNGRTARLVMNLVLLQNGYTLVNIKGNLKNRLKYYQALEQVQLNHEHTEFYKLILSSAEKSLLQHLELAG
jgi:Fic family protein